MKGYFKDSSGFVQLCLLAVVCLCSMCLCMFFSQVYLKLFPYNLHVMLFIENSLVIFLAAVITQYLISDKPMVNAFKLQWPGWKLVIIGGITFAVSSPMFGLLNEWNQQLAFPTCLKGVEEWMINSEKAVAELTRKLLSTTTIGGFWLNILQIAVIAGLCEELLLRGVLQKIMIRWTGNIHAGIWIAAIIFSAIHLQFYGFLPRMVMGAVLGYLFVWSGSLWVPVITHIANNASVIIFTSPADANPVAGPAGNPVISPWFGMLSLLLAVLGLYYLRKVYLQKSTPRTEEASDS